MERDVVISVNGLTISFHEPEFVAVRDLSFSIAGGETLAVVGESGSGKSLTALALMGLLPGTAAIAGDIALHSNAVTSLTRADNKTWQRLRGNEIGMVFQEPMSSLNPIMKIGKQLLEVITTHRAISKPAAKQLAIEWLAKVQLPSPDKIYNRYPHQLSGGQKQRVMIAMAMVNNPKLLIADEPTTALDVTVQKEIIELMHQLQQERNTAMIFITHDLALAADIADNMLVMYKGEAMEYGRTSEVLNNPVHPYTKALLACRPSPEHKGNRLPTVADFLEVDKGRPDVATADLQQPITRPADDVLLSVNDLRVWFTEHKDWLGKATSWYKAVDGVSFDLHKGEVLGLVGESGCGKSTISRALMGLLPVTEGQLIFDGKDLSKISQSEWKQVRKDIQLIFQDPFASLNPRMTVGDILKEPLTVHNIVPHRELRKEAQRLLDLVHLPADAYKRYPHQFSGGQRQRIGIARALALRPKLIICDESVSALDVSIQAQVLNLLKELQNDFDLSYLFISHDLSVVHYISDRVMVMQAGKIVESGDAIQVLKSPHHPYTQSLIAAMP
jgi:peptide/nickel transport system ATP-binding protein